MERRTYPEAAVGCVSRYKPGCTDTVAINFNIAAVHTSLDVGWREIQTATFFKVTSRQTGWQNRVVRLRSLFAQAASPRYEY